MLPDDKVDLTPPAFDNSIEFRTKLWNLAAANHAVAVENHDDIQELKGQCKGRLSVCMSRMDTISKRASEGGQQAAEVKGAIEEDKKLAGRIAGYAFSPKGLAVLISALFGINMWHNSVVTSDVAKQNEKIALAVSDVTKSTAAAVKTELVKREDAVKATIIDPVRDMHDAVMPGVLPAKVEPMVTVTPAPDRKETQ